MDFKVQNNGIDIKKHHKRKEFKTLKQKRLKQLNSKDNQDTRSGQSAYVDIVKKNEDFEFYYKHQNIVDSEQEWSKFLKILSEPLPSAFRISSYCKGQAQKMRDIIQSDYIKNCICGNNEESSSYKDLSIFPIPWYPNKLAWTINLSKVEIRKSPLLRKLHNFLISETETGDISRQEAVSMIPPLLLDIKSGQTVLDMCAAPGSKTAQIIEMLHQESGSTFITSSNNKNQSKLLDGLVVANDVDNRRCYMLVHQSKRLHSPCVVIINHDASTLPDFYKNDNENGKKLLKFDRVLADVPCSGDGTVRKNYDVWTKWNAGSSNNFHYLQLKIAKRGVELLAKDGIMAYSTCSFNPIENEAVIATLLNMSNGDLELINVAPLLPELKCHHGLETWVVMTRDNQIISSFKEVPENLQSQIRESLFPPRNATELNLKYCIRIMPHYQNTGGFFIALIKKKTDKIYWELQKNVKKCNQNENSSNKKNVSIKKKRFMGHREDPFHFLNDNDEDWISLKSYYRFPKHFSSNQLAHRCIKGKRRNIYYLTEKATDFIKNNEHIKLITGGARVFNRIDVKNLKCPYRVTQEGILSIFPYFMPNLEKYNLFENVNDYFNIIEFDFNHFVRLLKHEDLKVEQLDVQTRETMSKLSSGCCILYVKLPQDSNESSQFILPICVWKGKNSIRAYVAKNDRAHLLRLCGHEPVTIATKGGKRILDDGDENELNLRIDEDIQREQRSFN